MSVLWICIGKTNTVMDTASLRRDESRLYERQHTGMDLYGECDNRDGGGGPGAWLSGEG